MDMSLLTDIGLLLGTLGLNAGLVASASASHDAASETAHDSAYGDGGASLGTSGGNMMIASGNDLAWFLYGGNEDLTTAAGTDFASFAVGNDRTALDDSNHFTETRSGDDSADSWAGNDPLLLDHDARPTEGDGQHSAAWPDTHGLAQIDDYSAQTDQIELHYTPHFDDTNTEIPPEVTTALSDDTSFTTIYLDGEAVAHVQGSRLVEPSEVALVRAQA